MAYRKFRSTRLFDGYTFRNDHVLVIDNGGQIIDLIHNDVAGDDCEVYEGILTPGFINAHCHLELSHLKDVIPPHTGLIEFLCSVVTKRNFSREVIDQAIMNAENEMYQNGIVAVGDIGNTADTASVKKQSKIRWQNFVEVLSMTDENAQKEIRHYEQVCEKMDDTLKFSTIPHRSVLVPHAPIPYLPKVLK